MVLSLLSHAGAHPQEGRLGSGDRRAFILVRWFSLYLHNKKFTGNFQSCFESSPFYINVFKIVDSGTLSVSDKTFVPNRR